MTIHAYAKLVLTLVFVLGCTTGSVRLSPDYSLLEVKQAVEENLPGPLHKVSTNGRVYQTKAFRVPLYYRRKVHKIDGPPVERAYARIYILGTTRPYDLEVKLETEELISYKNNKPYYVIVGRHPEFEAEIRDKIVKSLAKKKKQHDSIDDFRPF